VFGEEGLQFAAPGPRGQEPLVPLLKQRTLNQDSQRFDEASRDRPTLFSGARHPASLKVEFTAKVSPGHSNSAA
jgi:hypothetical protein